MTEFQKQVLRAMPVHRGCGGDSLDEIAGAIGSCRIAVYSALWSLRKQGKADYHRGPHPDRWSTQTWFCKEAPDRGGEGE